MRDADRMAENGGVRIDILFDVDASHELDEFARLRALMCALDIDRLANQMDRHGIVPHLKCAIIPRKGEWSAQIGTSNRRAAWRIMPRRDARAIIGPCFRGGELQIRSGTT